MNQDYAKALLGYNVPIYIQHIKNHGGVTQDEMDWLQCQEDNPQYPDGMLNRADGYLLYPPNEKTFREGLFVLTLALAIMSFFPGGVRIFGLHFSVELENFVKDD